MAQNGRVLARLGPAAHEGPGLLLVRGEHPAGRSLQEVDHLGRWGMPEVFMHTLQET